MKGEGRGRGDENRGTQDAQLREFKIGRGKLRQGSGKQSRGHKTVDKSMVSARMYSKGLWGGLVRIDVLMNVQLFPDAVHNSSK